jgi:hypothetical protein
MDRCYAKTHFDGTGISFNPVVKSPFEKRVKAEKSARIAVKVERDHKRAVWGYQPYTTPPPSYPTKKRVWYYLQHRYMKKKDGTWAINGVNPYWNQ